MTTTENCAACHILTAGPGRGGPETKGATQRTDGQWQLIGKTFFAAIGASTRG